VVAHLDRDELSGACAFLQHLRRYGAADRAVTDKCDSRHLRRFPVRVKSWLHLYSFRERSRAR
jgi:hypothetical protein